MAPFRFAGEWRIRADADGVYAALADVDAYPEWWPGVAATHRIDAASGQIRLRSLLPLEVVFTATQRTADPVRRVLVAHFSGDLDGVGRWQVSAVCDGARARYDEHFVVRAPLARRGGVLARPVVYAGHEHLMRAGERGLSRYLGAAPEP